MLLIAFRVTIRLFLVLVIGFTLTRRLYVPSICILRLMIIMEPLLVMRLCTMLSRLLIPVGRRLTDGLLSMQSMLAAWPCMVWVNRMCRCLLADRAVLV